LFNKILQKKIVNPLFLFSLTFLVWTFSIFYKINIWWPSLAQFVIIAGSLYGINKKFGDTDDIDKFASKIFNSSLKTKLILSTIFIVLSVLIFIDDQNSIEDVTRSFAGVVWDSEGEPLSKVEIILPELNLIDTTDDKGRFAFAIADTNLITISLVAKKEGYNTYDAEGSVGNLYYNFVMVKR
jgi:hypothetical protein